MKIGGGLNPFYDVHSSYQYKTKGKWREQSLSDILALHLSMYLNMLWHKMIFLTKYANQSVSQKIGKTQTTTELSVCHQNIGQSQYGTRIDLLVI